MDTEMMQQNLKGIIPSSLSVIMPSYNAEQWIVQALESVRSFAGLNADIIVVDDKSTDNTVSLVSKFAEQDKRVNLVCLPENIGPGAARNAGLKQANGEYVIFFDADDIMIGENVKDAISLLDKYEADVAVLSYIQCSSRNTSLFSKMTDVDEDLFGTISRGSDFRIFKLEHYPQIIRTTNFPWNKIFRRSVFQNTGLAFPEYRLHEDILPCWHLFMHAKEIIYLNKPVGYHFVSPFGANETNKKTRQRLEVFIAFNEVSDLLKMTNADWKIYREFIYFSTHLLWWVRDNLPRECESELKAKVRYLFGYLDAAKINLLLTQDVGINHHLYNMLMEFQK